MSKELQEVRLSAMDQLLAQLMDEECSIESSLIERIQMILYHQMKRTDKELARAAEQERQRAVQKSISSMCDWKVYALSMTSAGVGIAAAGAGLAPKQLHGLASKVVDLSQYNLKASKDVQKLGELFSQQLSAYSKAFGTGGDLLGKHNEAYGSRQRALSDVHKTAHEELQSSSKDGGGRSDDCRNRANERQQHRHRIFGEMATR